MMEIMSAHLIDRLARLATGERAFKAGQALFRHDDRVTVIHVVLEGEVRLVRSLGGGGELTLQRARPGDVLAEASLFSERYHCDAVALCAGRTRVIDKSTLRRALSTDRDLANAWTARLAHEVQRARQRAEILSLRTVADRLNGWLAASGQQLPGRGAWRTLATEIAVSPEALYREIAQRRRQKAKRPLTGGQRA
ncbi:MAG: Crp/Fnr family transcriptional regulator [Enhydrobacter sp.]|nr:MAG: Crp/Fnr family transcriptional regulator [Enhydrobacter sp.]